MDDVLAIEAQMGVSPGINEAIDGLYSSASRTTIWIVDREQPSSGDSDILAGGGGIEATFLNRRGEDAQGDEIKTQ